MDWLIFVGGVLAVGLLFIFLEKRLRYVYWQRQAERMKQEGLETPDGMSVAAAAGSGRGTLPEPTDEIKVVPGSKKKVPYRCGHEGWSTFAVDFYGEAMTPSDRILKGREKCPDCIVEETRPLVIRCGLCGFAIFPGSAVAAYGGPKKKFRKDSSRTDSGSYIGCMRWDCCPSGGFFFGHWDGHRAASAFGGRSAAEQAVATGDVVYSEVTKKD